MPFFSIIIPTYNRAELIPRTIKSVLEQTFQDWELLIIDDGSSDNTKQVVQEFSDPRIRYIYQDNAERSAARNNGIHEAKGEWICFLDSDDTYLPNHLNVLHDRVAKEEEPALIATGIKRNSELGEQDRTLPDPKADNVLKEIWTKFLIPTQVCIHYSILQQDKFDERFRIWEDTHLFLRIAAEYPLKVIPEITCIQHVHEGSTVEQSFGNVQLKTVEQYIIAVNSLRNNDKVSKFLTTEDFDTYVESKFHMYLYQARKNKQYKTAFHIWRMAWMHKPSRYLFLELLKIPFS